LHFVNGYALMCAHFVMQSLAVYTLLEGVAERSVFLVLQRNHEWRTPKEWESQVGLMGL
jgi:hypothetical protein